MNRLYAYLYDDFLSGPSFQRILGDIETRCSVLGIQGRTSRLAIFRNAKELVEGLVRDGAQTIVIVGNDKTLEKVMWFLPDLPVMIGYIPVGEPSAVASMLGIPVGESACDVVAARRVETIDVGRINDRYFLSDVRVEASKAMVDVNGDFKIGAIHAGTIVIRNLGGIPDASGGCTKAKGGLLELSVSPINIASRSRTFFHRARPASIEGETRVSLRTGSIESSEPIDVFIDGHQVNGFRFDLSVKRDALRIITGRRWRFEAPENGVLPKKEKAVIVSTAQRFMHRWRNRYTR